MKIIKKILYYIFASIMLIPIGLTYILDGLSNFLCNGNLDVWPYDLHEILIKFVVKIKHRVLVK